MTLDFEAAATSLHTLHKSTSQQSLVMARFSESSSCKNVKLYNYFYSDKRLRRPETLRPRIPGPIKVAPVLVAGLPGWLARLELRTFNANYLLETESREHLMQIIG